MTSRHQLEHSLGEGSPLARLYERGAQGLLLGADYSSCTSQRAAVDFAVAWLRARGR